MAKKQSFISDLAFHEQLWHFYAANRRKIRAKYNDTTRKFLDYNDKNENPDAFLRAPQFEALEMYVFIKEFLKNAHMYEIFDAWRKRVGIFADDSYLAIRKNGQSNIYDIGDSQNELVFERMKKFRESYPNYIYALAMGLGKTVLMATCIFYEFLLAMKYPSSDRYCHNALVFAPDKTVLTSLREIITFDKTKVIPPEYAPMLDANVQFHFLEGSGELLCTVDDSDFNIVISNNQKIIVKQRRQAPQPTDRLFCDGNDELDESALIENRRFKKLCRLPRLGVYVDEAHHLFGANLEKELRSGSPDKTTLRNTINLLAESTSILACHNFTGTPYVKSQVLPEVVYAYGLRSSIARGYLKDADPIGFSRVKDDEFLRLTVSIFLERYGGKRYEGLTPKLAIFASTIEEACEHVRPSLEAILGEFGIKPSAILVNVGDQSVTTDADIRLFNELDIPGSEGNEKQFIILVEKGREGWNCRSLLGVAMFRSPKSKVFVLQATMRCLRKLTDDQLTATVFLSKENYDILSDELLSNCNLDITELGKSRIEKKQRFEVRVVKPIRTLKIKQIRHEYTLAERELTEPISFGLARLDLSRYDSLMYEKKTLRFDRTEVRTTLTELSSKIQYSEFSLIAELSRYLNLPCLLVGRLLRESRDGIETIVECVNRHNEIIYDIIAPTLFESLYEQKSALISSELEVSLLREPRDGDHYEFSALPELVIARDDPGLTDSERAKSFHADRYCFDSDAERRCFLQYLQSDRVSEIYYIGMFTSGQSELAVQYFDPETQSVRRYYPDFLAKMTDGSLRLIEVKSDALIDDATVLAKKSAAREMAIGSGIEYIVYAASKFKSSNVLDAEYGGKA